MKEHTDKDETIISEKEFYDNVIYFRNQIVRDPKNIENYFNLAACFLINKNYEEAVKYYNTAFERQPKNYLCHYNLGVCYCYMEFYEKSLNYLENALSLKKDDDKIWGYLGLVYDKMGEIEKAVSCYKEALNINPLNLAILSNISTIYYNQKKYVLSLEKIELFMQENGEPNVFDYNHYALCLVANNHYQKAKEHYKIALKKDDSIAILHNNFANCLKHLKEYSVCEEHYKRALNLDKENLTFLFNYGEFYYENDQKKQAEEIFRTLSKQTPDDYEVWQYLELCCAKEHPKRLIYLKKMYGLLQEQHVLQKIINLQKALNLIDEELEYRQKLHQKITFDKENNTALVNLLMLNNSIEKAWDLLEKFPTEYNEEMYWNFSHYFNEKRNVLNELYCLERILKNNPSHTTGYYRLSKISLRKGQYTYALKCARKSAPLLDGDFNFWKSLMYSFPKDNASDIIDISIENIHFIDYDSELYNQIVRMIIKRNVFDEWIKKITSYCENTASEEQIFRIIQLLEKNDKYTHARKIMDYLLSKSDELTYKIHNAHLLAKNNIQAALGALEKLNTHTPHHHEILSALGKVQLKAKKIPEAEKYLQLSLKIEDNNADSWGNMALIEFQRRNLSQALHNIDKALAIDPFNTTLLRNKAIILLRNNEMEEAEGYLRASLRGNIYHAVTWNYIGRIYKEKKKLQKARICFLKSIVSNKKYQKSWEDLADVFETLHNRSKQAKCLAQLKKLKEANVGFTR